MKYWWRKLVNYTLPNFWHRLCGKTITEKGERFCVYCAKIYENPDYEPQDYEEMMFDEKIGKENRKEVVKQYIFTLAPYINGLWRNEN